jgi:hypothetical protein
MERVSADVTLRAFRSCGYIGYRGYFGVELGVGFHCEL